MENPESWARLGRLLIARRVELGYTVRAAFVKAKRLKHGRTVSDLENAKRANFEPATLAQMEQIYEWAPGSIEAVLAGGDPTPLPAAQASGSHGWAGRASGLAPGDADVRRGGSVASVHVSATGGGETGSIAELRAQLSAVSRALQDAWEEYAYALQRVDQAQAAVQAALARRHDLQHQQHRLNDLIRSLEQDLGHDDAAPTTRADVDLAARVGEPHHRPDTTTGEESQDPSPDDFDPA